MWKLSDSYLISRYLSNSLDIFIKMSTFNIMFVMNRDFAIISAYYITPFQKELIIIFARSVFGF